MSNRPRGPRRTPRGPLSIEPLENRRLLSGSTFFQFLPHRDLSVGTFVAQIDHFLNSHGLILSDWFQQSKEQAHGQHDNSGSTATANVGHDTVSRFEGKSLADLDGKVAQSITKAFEGWAKSLFTAVDSAHQLVVDVAEITTDGGSSVAQTGTDIGSISVVLGSATGSSAVINAGTEIASISIALGSATGSSAIINPATQIGSIRVALGSATGSSAVINPATQIGSIRVILGSATGSSAANAGTGDGSSTTTAGDASSNQDGSSAGQVPSNSGPTNLSQLASALSPVTSVKSGSLSSDAVHAAMVDARPLSGGIGMAMSPPAFLENQSLAYQTVAQPNDATTDTGAESAAHIKSSPRRTDLAGQGDQMSAVSLLLESAKSGDLMKASEQLAPLTSSKPGITTSETEVGILLQQQAAMMHTAGSASEDYHGAAAHAGRGALGLEAPDEAHVLTVFEGMGAAEGDVANLTPYGSNMLLNGWPVDTATLERALHQFLSHVHDLGGELSKSLQMMGGSPWLMGLAVAGTAYEVVRRQRRGGKRKKSGLASGEGRRTLTWIAGLPGSLSDGEA
jgi:hypothetical protein